METARLFTVVFEFMPVIVAIIAFWQTSLAWKHTKQRKLLALAALSCFTLVALQLSWFNTFVIEQSLIDTVWISQGWTFHNSLTMLVVVLLARSLRR